MEYQGTVVKIGQTVQVSDKYKKREFIVTDNAKSYPQFISFQLGQDKCDIIEPIKIGDEVTVKFNLRGRAWTNPQGETKYFNSLDAWAIIKVKDVEIDISIDSPPMPKPDDHDNELGF